jgi:hypothetical protein
MGFLNSCKYDDQYSGDPIPVISNLILNKSDFKQFADTVVIGFDYRDGDGDLGFESADSLSVEIKDIRFSKADEYHLPPLAPTGSKIDISGTIRVTLKNIFLIAGGNTETTQFQIRVKDRAQHWSNLLVSKSVNINK